MYASAKIWSYCARQLRARGARGGTSRRGTGATGSSSSPSKAASLVRLGWCSRCVPSRTARKPGREAQRHSQVELDVPEEERVALVEVRPDRLRAPSDATSRRGCRSRACGCRPACGVHRVGRTRAARRRLPAARRRRPWPASDGSARSRSRGRPGPSCARRRTRSRTSGGARGTPRAVARKSGSHLSSSWISVKYGALPACSSPRPVRRRAEVLARGDEADARIARYGRTAASTSPPPGPFSDTTRRQFVCVCASTDSIASAMKLRAPVGRHADVDGGSHVIS